MASDALEQQALSRDFSDKDLSGFRYFKKLKKLLEALHKHGCERDKAANRKLHFDQYILLILLRLFNPIVHSLRDIVHASTLEKVQKQLGVCSTSLGSFSEAARVFDPELLLGILHQLGSELAQVASPQKPLSDARQVLTLIDGTLLKALPRITQAFWKTDHGGGKHHAFRLHVQFDLQAGVPSAMKLTNAANSGESSERAILQQSLQSNRAYVMDRGYVKFGLFNAIAACGSTYFCRLREDTLVSVISLRELSQAAQAAGVAKDVEAKLGTTAKPSATTDHRLRVVYVPITPHQRRGGRKGKGSGPANDGMLLIATNDMTMPAELVAIIYRHRWAVEIFFRFFKQVLGCRHLLSDHPAGITLQAYCVMIACLLIHLYTGRKPTRAMWRVAGLYLMGWASEAEVMAYLHKPDRTGTKKAIKDALWKKLGV